MASRVKKGTMFRLAEDDPLKVCLMMAVRLGNLEYLEKTLGPDSQPNLFYQQTLDIALETACKRNKKSVAEILIRSGARVQQYLDCLIHDVTKEGNVITTEEMEIIKLLLENSDKDQKRFVLSKVVSKGRSDLIDLLLTSEVGLNLEDILSSALFDALWHGHIDCIEILMRHGGKIDVEKAIVATMQGNECSHETLKLFPQLYKQALQNVECINRILYQVVSFGNIEFLKFMLESETNLINLIKDKDQLLIRTKNAETLQFLIDHGLVVPDSVNICSHVLDLIRQEKLDMAKIFFDSGLNVDSENFKTGHNGTPLTEARNAEIVQYLIDKGANVNERVSKSVEFGQIISTTALLEALFKNDEVLKVLLKNGADPEVTNYKGYSALMVASQTLNGENKVEMLLKAGAEVNKLSECGETALSIAANILFDSTKCVKMLLQHGADVNIKGSHKTALLNAVGNRKIETTQMLVESGMNTQTLNTCNEKGNIPLIMAVTLFPDDKSSKLINIFNTAGADLNKRDDQGYTALMRAAQYNQNLTLKTLIDSGVDVNASQSGETALSIASSADCTTKSVEILLQNGADVNITAFFNAIRKGNFKTLQMLVESGMNTQILNTCNEKGDTPLLMAVTLSTDHQSHKLINILATAGADLNKRDAEGYTALMRAAQQEKHLTLKALINAGADVNARFQQFYLTISAVSLLLHDYNYSRGKLLCVEELCNHGADTSHIEARDFSDVIINNKSSLIPKIIQNGFVPDEEHYFSPLRFALETGRDKIARYLLGNRFLTKSDILFKFESQPYTPRCQEVLTELTSQPFSLLTLSFVEVSRALGSGSDRENRVSKTGLPPILQKKLLFKTEEVSLSVD